MRDGVVVLEPIVDPTAFVATRTSWHTLAERVLAPARHAATGRIGLRPAPGGFATPEFATVDLGRRTLAVTGAELVIVDGSGETRRPITTLAAAASAAGTAPDADTGVYVASTPADPDATLTVDPGAAAALAAWFALGDEVLARWREDHGDESPSEAQLWPEHFDLATDLGPDEPRRANYGLSPGDGSHALPYAYVGPWESRSGAFWNAGSYARLGYEEVLAAADPAAAVSAFFAEARRAIGTDPRA